MNKNIGWECPKCGACYAPTVSRCWNCSGLIEAVGKPMSPVPWGERTPQRPCPALQTAPQISKITSSSSPGIYDVWNLQRAAERAFSG